MLLRFLLQSNPDRYVLGITSWYFRNCCVSETNNTAASVEWKFWAM